MKSLKLILLCSVSIMGTYAQVKEPLQTITISKKLLEHSEKCYLSNFIDKISFVPLETNVESLLREGYALGFTDQYIFASNNCFDWDGTWKFSIGKKGNGPVEDPEGVRSATSLNNKFYTNGSKYIAYDARGKATGQVRSLHNDSNKELWSTMQSCFIPIGQSLFLSSSKKVFLIDPTNFEVILERNIVNLDASLQNRADNSPGSATYFEDKIVYQHPFNDTIFHVQNNTLHPRLIINIDDEIKVPPEVYSKKRELMDDWFNKGTRLSYLLRNKVQVRSVSETNKFLIIRVIAYGQTSDSVTKAFYILKDKKSNQVQCFAEKDWEDDMLNLPVVKPIFYKEKLIRAVWPEELFRIVEKQKASKLPVDPKLLKLIDQLEPDDNPVLIVGYLK